MNKELPMEQKQNKEPKPIETTSAAIAANPLLYAGVFVGQKVYDKDGTIGKVVDCSEEHNILVEFDEGGQGFYCLHDGCPSEDCLFACTQRTGIAEGGIIGIHLLAAVKF
jgi:hypothetical protein